MVEFSLGNLVSAEERVWQCIAVAQKYNKKLEKDNRVFPKYQQDQLIKYDTCYRHLAKIKLLQQDSPASILRLFWYCYDDHKELKLNKNENRDRLLIDDLTLLFMIKTYEFSSEESALAHAFSYVRKQANIQLSKTNACFFMKNLIQKKKSLENGEKLPLSHSFFFEEKELQPHFTMPNKKVEPQYALHM